MAVNEEIYFNMFGQEDKQIGTFSLFFFLLCRLEIAYDWILHYQKWLSSTQPTHRFDAGHVASSTAGLQPQAINTTSSSLWVFQSLSWHFFPPHDSTLRYFLRSWCPSSPSLRRCPQEPQLGNGFVVLSYPTLCYFCLLPAHLFTSQALLFLTRRNLKP